MVKLTPVSLIAGFRYRVCSDLLCVRRIRSPRFFAEKNSVDSLYKCNFIVTDNVGDTHILIIFSCSAGMVRCFTSCTKCNAAWQDLPHLPMQALGAESSRRWLKRFFSESVIKEIRLFTIVQSFPQGVHSRQEEVRMYPFVFIGLL